MSYWGIFKTLLLKDLKLELRTREGVIAVLVFSLLSLLIFSMIIPQGKEDGTMVSGIFWIVVLFASILGFDRSINRDFVGKNIQAILMVPVDKSSIFIAKLTFNVILVTFIQMVTFFLILVLFNFSPPVSRALLFLLYSFLVTIGLSSSGTLYATVSQKTRSKELMLPLLFIPAVIPLIMAGIQLGGSQLVVSSTFKFNWLVIVLLFDFLYISLGLWLFELMIVD